MKNSQRRTRRPESDRDTVTVQIKKPTHKRACVIAAARVQKIGDFIDYCVHSVVQEEEKQLKERVRQLAAS